MEIENLKNKIKNCDALLLTCARNRMDIVQHLTTKHSVPLDKIIFFRHNEKTPEYWQNEWMTYKPLCGPGYGQFYDDVVVQGLFFALGMDLTKIRYLEIGTNDPVCSNNTFSLYLHGARGVLIDALPISEYFSKKIRPEDIFIRAAISDRNKEDTTFYIGTSTQGSSLNVNLTTKNHIPVQVQVIGINELLSKIGYAPDYITVDAEGEDEHILRALDYKKYRPTIVETEMDKMEKHGAAFIEFMEDKGYVLYTLIGGNFIFVDKTKWERCKNYANGN